jgi:hypothetical protein
VDKPHDVASPLKQLTRKRCALHRTAKKGGAIQGPLIAAGWSRSPQGAEVDIVLKDLNNLPVALLIGDEQAATDNRSSGSG